MAFRIDYIAKETGNNLFRNPSLTIATVLTVAVSLALLGAALAVRQGVEGLNTRFRDDVEFLIWMRPDATPDQVREVEEALGDSPSIKDFTFVDEKETFNEFAIFYEDKPEIVDLVTPDQLPTSFRVVPEIPDLPVVRGLAEDYRGLSGVRDVDLAADYIKRLNSWSNKASWVMTGTALAAGVASSLLMYNTIRTALFARRREVEVMRLVGANNWFIRVPFMLEGCVQGLAGAMFSALSIVGMIRLISNEVEGSDLRLFDSFALGSGQLLWISLTLLGAGAMIGFVGSGVAVTRYLDA